LDSIPTLAKISIAKNHVLKPWNQFGSQGKRLRHLKRLITMAVWNVRVYGGKMQEVIKRMEHLKFKYHPSRKK
jgi:hypothetical protein